MRYPVTRNGLAVPIEEVGYEPMIFMRRVTNRHHLQFNRADYAKSPLRRIFRGLSSRVVDMRMVDHNDLHERFSAPKLPTDIQMIDCLEEYMSLHGVIECVREKHTHLPYEINQDQWNAIKRGAHGLQEVHTARDSIPYQLA